MQKQSMKCVDARHLIHLAVGDDTLTEEERQLTEHLHCCSDCRSYHAGMVDAMHVIEQVRDEDVDDIPTGKVWPTLEGRLQSRRSFESAPVQRRFNGAVAALCVCSLTLAMVTAVQNLPTNDVESFGNPASIPGVSISYQPGVGGLQNGGLQNGGLQRPDGAHQLRLLRFSDRNGTSFLVDPDTSQMYVPFASAPQGQDLSF
ncbi:MAG: zf-HC2 domain-containing protein [Fuerstiella sp.]|jgi:hypothetical protein|nr:zf-HC2 domain-containing protein [Fuerstiella sp.]MCP4510263.1 zf-HC2 domain-containing protein [Fuerstiella sp.]MDG2129480.1 zf-HC2 domain-containing protein [Fuerstiella sp.]